MKKQLKYFLMGYLAVALMISTLLWIVLPDLRGMVLLLMSACIYIYGLTRYRIEVYPQYIVYHRFKSQKIDLENVKELVLKCDRGKKRYVLYYAEKNRIKKVVIFFNYNNSERLIKKLGEIVKDDKVIY